MYDSDEDCTHVDVGSDGYCVYCDQYIGVRVYAEVDETNRKTFKTNVINDTIRNIQYALDLTDIPNHFKDLAKKTLIDNTIQIRSDKTARIVVYTHIYAAMYSRADVSPEELFMITPNRLSTMFGLTKKDISKANSYISSGRIKGPGVVAPEAYLFFIEFKRNFPKNILCELIQDEFITSIRCSIDPVRDIEIITMAPHKFTTAYINIAADFISKPSFVSQKKAALDELYSFYDLKVSMVKDLYPTIKRRFFYG